MPIWQLHVRDASGDRVAALSDYRRATFIPRFNGVGAWLVEGIPFRSRAAQALVPGASIEALRDGHAIVAGPVVQPTAEWSNDGYTLKVSGLDWALLLAGRLAYPAAPSTNLNGGYSDDRTGPAETVMYGYVDDNLGPSAAAIRQHSAGVGLAADNAQGNSVTFSARFDRLIDLLTRLGLPELAGGNGLGFRIVPVDPDVYGYALQFQVYAPTDRTSEVQFAPGRRNLNSYAYDRRLADTNYVVVGGSGDGVARTFVTAENAQSLITWGIRLEGFKDQRQTADNDELTQAAQEELAAKGDQLALTVEPVDTEAVAYGTDYSLGDLVTVIVDGLAITDVVREVQFDLDGRNGETITPLVGSHGAVPTHSTAERALDILLARQADLARRLGRLERAQ